MQVFLLAFGFTAFISMFLVMSVYISQPYIASAAGCGDADLTDADEHWAGVNADDQTFASGTVQDSRVSYTDMPSLHLSHDHNFGVILDPEFRHLSMNGKGMEVEWEIGTKGNTGATDNFPKEFWPWPGDKVSMAGHWIYDCGHGHYLKPGVLRPSEAGGDYVDEKGEPIPFVYDTEIHPPVMVSFTRIEPVHFSGEKIPTPASKTYIFINSQGYIFNNPTAGKKFEFDVPLPESLKLKSPSETALSVTVDSVTSPGYGKVSPEVTPTPAENPTKLHVVFDLTKEKSNLKYGAVVTAHWSTPLRSISETYHQIRVTFNSIQILDDHDANDIDLPLVPTIHDDGEFNSLWAGVNGKWIELSGPSGHFGLTDAREGKSYSFRDRSIDVIVPEGGLINISSTGWESDGMDSCFGLGLACPGSLDENNAIGKIDRHYALNELGVHNDCADPCDYKLGLTLTEIARLPMAPNISCDISKKSSTKEVTCMPPI